MMIKVPVAISDYIESEKQAGYTLYGAYLYMGQCSLLPRQSMSPTEFEVNKVHEWVIDGHQEDFATAWISGYTVEDEEWIIVLATRMVYQFFKSVAETSTREETVVSFVTSFEKAHVYNSLEEAEKVCSHVGFGTPMALNKFQEGIR